MEGAQRLLRSSELGFDHAGMSCQEKKARQGVPPAVVFHRSLLFGFLILAALYESWTLPFKVPAATRIAIFLIPVSYYVQHFAAKRRKPTEHGAPAGESATVVSNLH